MHVFAEGLGCELQALDFGQIAYDFNSQRMMRRYASEAYLQ